MSKIWSKEETLWSFALYGTAVGAGTLFLPIQLGSAGAIVLFITALVAWPLTYWPHKALSQFILSANIAPGTGITSAVNHYYGKKIGNLITGLYFLAFFVVVLIYAVAITNSLAEQVAHRTPMTPGLRALLSLGVVLVLNLIFLMGRQVTIKVMGFLVFPLIACFLFLSLYLIRDWHPEHLTSQMQFSPQTLHQVWISIPVMVFAFSHTPIISTFAIDQQEKHGDLAMGKCKKNHEGGLHHHLRQRAVFCLQLSAGDPGNLYRDRPRSGGDYPLRPVDGARRAGMAGGDRHHRRRRRYVEIVSRNLLRSD